MKRKNYLPPETTVCGVELESSICSGSVIMTDATKEIVIEDQAIDKEGALDFTDNSWDS